MSVEKFNYNGTFYCFDTVTGKIYENGIETDLSLKNEIMRNSPFVKKLTDKKNSSIQLDELRSYGTRARDIYNTLARKFGWNVNLNETLHYGRRMMVRNVDYKLNVQFLTYNNINKKTPVGGWENEICLDELKCSNRFRWKGFFDRNDVLLFVNKDSDGYYFYGVYEYFDSVERNERFTKIYKRKSKKYPVDGQ